MNVYTSESIYIDANVYRMYRMNRMYHMNSMNRMWYGGFATSLVAVNQPSDRAIPRGSTVGGTVK